MAFCDHVIEDDAQQGAEESLRALDSALSSHFIVRKERCRDYGVDGTIEVKLPLSDGRNAVTNCRAYFQAKAAKSPVVDADGCVSYRLEPKNFRYLSTQLPAVYFLYDRERRRLHFGWASQFIDDLDAGQGRQRWRAQESVSVRFRQVLDNDAKEDIRQRILEHFESTRSLQDGPGFIRSFDPSKNRLVQLNVSSSASIGRESEIQLLTEALTPGSLVHVTGPPGIGKINVVSSVLWNDVGRQRRDTAFPHPYALLYADIHGFIRRPVIRSVAAALGYKAVFDDDSALDSDSTRDIPLSTLVAQVLPSYLQQRSALVVLENAHVALTDEVSRQDLDALIKSHAFRGGSVILVAQGGDLPNGRPERRYKGELPLDELDPDAALRVLVAEGIPAELAIEALASDEPGVRLFVPRVLIGSIDRFLGAPLPERTGVRLMKAIQDEGLAVVDEEIKRVAEGIMADEDLWIGAFAVAIVAQWPWTTERIEVAGVSTSIRQRLLELRWLRSHEGEYKLSSFARTILRAKIGVEFRGTSGGAIAERIRQRLARVIQGFNENVGEFEVERCVRALEESLAWLRADCPNMHPSLERSIIKHLLPHTVDDLVFPFALQEADDFDATAEPLGVDADAREELLESIATLSLSTRLRTNPSRLYEDLAKAIELAVKASTLSAVVWRVLDIAAFVLAYRHGKIADAKRLRECLLDRALVAAGAVATSESNRKWAISWQSNYAFTAIHLGEVECARKVLNCLYAWINQTPLPDSSSDRIERAVHHARVVILLAGTSLDGDVRKGLLREAVEMSQVATEASGWRASRVLYYLRCVRRLISEVANDHDRIEVMEDARMWLHFGIGNEEGWPLEVRTAYAVLARSVAGLVQEPELALKVAGQAIELLVRHAGETELSETAVRGDNRSLLVLARCHALRGSLLRRAARLSEATTEIDKALKLTRLAADVAPTAAAWMLLFLLWDQREWEFEENEYDSEMFARRARKTDKGLNDAFDDCKAWLDSLELVGSEEGALELFRWHRRWQHEGSLIVKAMATDQHIDWDRLSNGVRRRVLTKIYRDRQQVLSGIERRFSAFVDLHLSRIRLQAQYQRLIAINSNFECDSKPVIDLIDRALAIWPHSKDLRGAKAQFFRYIWDYPQAILEYRRLLQSGVGHVHRNEFCSNLIEVLLTAGTYAESVIFPDGVQANSGDLLDEAMRLLNTLPATRQTQRSQSILSDRLAYEQGIPINWEELERVYDTVVGDDYLENFNVRFDELREEAAAKVVSIATLVRENFTGFRDLAEMGRLFLRRAEKEGGPAAWIWAKKAYAVFEACAMLERSWGGKERLSTTYLRGRALTVGAFAARALNPFGLELTRKYSTELDMAGGAMHRVINQSVGLFRDEARRARSDLGRLRDNLQKEASE